MTDSKFDGGIVIIFRLTIYASLHHRDVIPGSLSKYHNLHFQKHSTYFLYKLCKLQSGQITKYNHFSLIQANENANSPMKEDVNY